MKAAVIILNWNGEKLLREFLPSVVANTDPALGHIIVADNGSDDGSLKLLAERFPSVEVLAFPENYGFAGGYNRAVAAVAGRFELAVLLNSDVETPPGWLDALSGAMKADPKIGACQPKILAYTDKKNLNMRVRPEAFWTATATHTAAGASSRPWRPTTDNTTTR